MKRFSLSLWTVFALGPMLLPAQVKQPSIVFDSQVKDFGKVTEGETIKHVFKFANKGEAMLEILKVQPS